MVKEIESLKKENLIIGSDFYVKESLCHIHIFSDCIYITNLKNALKRGKTCKRYCLSFKNSINMNIILKMSHVCILREPPHASTRATMFISGSHLPI